MRGYWQLDNHVVVQSDLFSAAPFVVPFLLEILNRSDRHGSDLVYDLLFEIGNGSAPESAKSDFRLPEWPESERSLQWACHNAVKSGVERYLQDVKEAKGKLKLKAAQLVAMLGSEDPAVQKRLKSTIESLGDAQQRQQLLKECDLQ